jgi:hypothetical protein
MTKEEKLQLDLWRQQVEAFEAELAELQSLVGDPDYPNQQDILDDIARTEKALEILAVVLRAGRIPSTFPEINETHVQLAAKSNNCSAPLADSHIVSAATSALAFYLFR